MVGLAEIGDKTQIATIGLAARLEVFLPVVIGTTFGKYTGRRDRQPNGGQAPDPGHPHRLRDRFRLSRGRHTFGLRTVKASLGK